MQGNVSLVDFSVRVCDVYVCYRLQEESHYNSLLLSCFEGLKAWSIYKGKGLLKGRDC